jgi:hypothetical protein
MDAYVGGAYELAFGKGYISYEEAASTWYSNLFYGSGYWNYEDAYGWWYGTPFNPVSDNEDVSSLNVWDDSTWTFDVIDYLPSNIADMAGLNELYE